MSTPLGGTSFVAIINQPEIAIIDLARAQWKPVIQGRRKERTWRHRGAPDIQIEARLLLPIVLGSYHRAISGTPAARFMRHLADTLTKLESFALVGSALSAQVSMVASGLCDHESQ